MIDGIDIKDLHLHKMRSFISVVSQEPILFNCSISDNIAYGLEETPGMDDIIAAARDANIHEFITSQPMVCSIGCLMTAPCVHIIIFF